MGDKQERGVVYLAMRKDIYIEEAFLSAASVRERHPDLPITLFTDLPEHPLLALDMVSEAVPIDSRVGYGGPIGGVQLDRIEALRNSPYRLTLHLDGDTRVRAPSLDPLFEALEELDIAIAEAAVDRSISRKQVGRVMFNNGVIAFRDTPAVAALLAEWKAIAQRNFDRANEEASPEHPLLEHIADPEQRRHLLFLDQVAMVEIFSPEVNKHGLVYSILGEAWNFRGAPGQRRLFGPVMIDHQPVLRNHIWPDLLMVARGLWGRGLEAAAFHVYRHVMRRKLAEMEGFPRPILIAELRNDLVGHNGDQTALFDRLAALGSGPSALDDQLRAAVMHAKIGQKDEATAICQTLAPGG